MLYRSLMYGYFSHSFPLVPVGGPLTHILLASHKWDALKIKHSLMLESIFISNLLTNLFQIASLRIC